jgi:hypothetical protein
VDALDVLTVLVLVFVGVRVSSGTRVALSASGRDRVKDIVSGVRLHHVLLAVPALAAVFAAVVALASLPGLSWGWWTAIGGLGNPVTGATERTDGSPLEWIVPLVFVVLLLPALPLFAEREERMFRLGAEGRTQWGRIRRGVEFGLVHAIIGIPIGAALGLSVGGWYFTWAYLRRWRETHDQHEAVLESTRSHLAYNGVVLVLVVVLISLG